MTDASAGFKHQAAQATNGDMGADAPLIDHDERAIQNIQTAFFNKEDRRPFTDGNGTGRP
ncbi:hypothetical protein Gbfr_005_062 [Gluconobacter frateurii M-2]|nr:hypothetical protein Gbfr_005_062 [Gluconobacter frateurii M-2]